MKEGGRACDSSSKSRGKGEESVDGCQFATVHEEAPRPTRPFGNCTKGLAVISLTCRNGTTCQRNMVCNFVGNRSIILKFSYAHQDASMEYTRNEGRGVHLHTLVDRYAEVFKRTGLKESYLS